MIWKVRALYLTRDEEAILNGEYGEALQKAMQLVVTIGDIFNADKLLSIRSSQISGISYKNIGDAGLELITDFKNKGGHVRTFATLNPAGMDILDWRKMRIPSEFAKKQVMIISAFTEMGALPTCTCTPYLIGNMPLLGEHISWAESSAVSFANSVLGAKTNREGGPLSLASALVGKTPNYGLHLDENRVPRIRVKVNEKLVSPYDYSVLGYFIGQTIQSGIPYIEGLKGYTVEKLKALSASGAASGNIALYYLKDHLPLPKGFSVKDIPEKIEVGKRELAEVKSLFIPTVDPDIVAIGCPHLTINEIKKVAMMLKGKKLKKGKTLWVATSYQNKVLSERLGYSKIIESAGGIIAADTCMVVAPLERMGFKCLATNSAKAAHYVPSTAGIPTMLVPLEKAIKLIVS